MSQPFVVGGKPLDPDMIRWDDLTPTAILDNVKALADNCHRIRRDHGAKTALHLAIAGCMQIASIGSEWLSEESDPDIAPTTPQAGRVDGVWQPIDYQFVYGANPHDLVLQVRERLAHGWRPVGTPNREMGAMLGQAMIRYGFAPDEGRGTTTRAA